MGTFDAMDAIDNIVEKERTRRGQDLVNREYSIEDGKFYIFGQQVTEEIFQADVESHGGWYDPVRKLAGVSAKSRSNITTGNIPGEGQNPEVDHPAHYNQHPSGVECIDIVRWMGFNLGNVVKYLWRDGLKETEVELQDLEKAAWYLNNEILKRKDLLPRCDAHVGNPIITCSLPKNHKEDHVFPEIDGNY